MLEVKESILIRCPVGTTFSYLSNADNWPRWTSEVLEAHQTSSGAMAAGTTLQGIDRLMGVKVRWTSTISEYVTNKKMGQIITSGNRRVEQHLSFEPAGEGTNFTFNYVMKDSGMPSILNPVLVKLMRRGIKRNLKKLKLILEHS